MVLFQNLTSNTTLHLKPGQHVLHRYQGWHLVGLHDVSIIGMDGSEPVMIKCDDGIGMTFINITHLTISNIVVDGCGLSNDSLHNATDIVREILDLSFVIPDSIRIGLFLAYCTDLTISDSVITNTQGLGMLGINIVGNSEVKNVSFTRNIRPSCIKEKKRFPFNHDQEFSNQIGGGAYFLYEDHLAGDSFDSNTLRISYCNFKFNADCSYAGYTNVNYQYFYNAPYVIGGGGGLSIFTPQIAYDVSVVVSDTHFVKNDARYGGGAQVGVFAGFSINAIQFLNCTFDSNGFPIQEESSLSITPSAEGGAGIAIFMDLLKYSNATINHQSFNCEYCKEIFFFNTTFARNSAIVQGGGVFGYSFSKNFRTNYNLLEPGAILIFDTCRFHHNSARYGSGLYVSQRVTQGLDGSWVLKFDNTIVEQNRPEYNDTDGIVNDSSNDKISAVDLRSVIATIGRKSFIIRNNEASGLHLTSSILVMMNETSLILQNNHARRGAGIYMDGNIPVILPHYRCNILIEGNVATAEGGGIYFEQQHESGLGPFSSVDCFISTVNPYSGSLGERMFNSNITLEFKSNQAPIGSMVFGSTLNSCSWAQDLNLSKKDLFIELYYNFSSTFKFDQVPNGITLVSSTPRSIYTTNTSISSYPGQRKNIDVHVLDVFGKEIEAVITSDMRNGAGYNIKLGSSGFWYDRSTEQVPVYIEGEGENMITLSLYTITNLVSTDLTVEILKCPIGFDSGNTCRCNNLLENHMIACTSEKVEIEVPKQKWLGCDHWSNETDCSSAGDLILLECFLGYCNPRSGAFNQSNYTNLCAEGSKRTGLMCGQCEKEYSVIFGSNQCKKCAKTDLGIILGVTAIWGLLLFVLIALFEITIDKGWTNMLILFCNIVFPYISYQSSPAHVFKYLLTPARWVGLEPGIDICLYYEANAFARVSYLILFPAYLYILMLLFAILCRYSSFLSKRFAPHKTLVTLTFLSYVVVFKASAEILSPIKVKNLSGTYESWRWLIDPQILYFRGWHALLGVVSIILVFVYVIPFPILLLSPTLAYKYGQRFKPFLDAIWAPFKPKYRIWVSIRLLLRIVIIMFTKFVLFSNDHGFQINLATLSVFLFVQTFIQPFKDQLINFCDNLLVLVALLLHFMGYVGYLEHQVFTELPPFTTILACFVYALGYLVLLVTFLWYSRFSFNRLLKKLRCCCKKRQSVGDLSTYSPFDTVSKPNRHTHTSISVMSDSFSNKGPHRTNFTRVRESLLEESIQSS